MIGVIKSALACCLFLLAFPGIAVGQESASNQELAVDNPRAFGYFIGDILIRRYQLDMPMSATKDLDLPGPERVGLWFERRQSRIEADDLGQTWLVISYQIINSPRQTTQVQLPGLNFALPGQSVNLKAMSVTISPIQAGAGGPVTVDSLRADRQPLIAPLQPVRQRRNYWLIGLAVVLASWLGWYVWRRWRDRARLPFDRALGDLRRMKNPNDNSAAWHRLHQAINESAGQVIQPGNLSGFVSQASHFNNLKPELEDFFEKSDQRFFAPESNREPFDLIGLTRKLHRIERKVAS